MKNILIVTYGGGHVRALIPIIKLLKKESNYNLYIIGLSLAKKELIDNNIECMDLYNYIKEHKAIEYGKLLAKENHNSELEIDYKDTIAYYGIGMYDLAKEYGEKKAYEIFKDKGRKAFLPVIYFEKLMKELNIELLLTTSSPRFEEAALIAASNLSINSIRVEQLFAQGNTPILENVRYCVLNTFVKKILVEKGIKNDNIEITGQPAFDNLSVNKDIACKLKSQLSTNKKNILWISPGNKDSRDILKTLINIEKKRNDINLIIKLHPNESGNEKIELLKDSNSKALIMKDNLYELIYISDIVIVEVSAVGLQTILLDKNLITINFTGKEDKVPYAKSGAAIGVYNISNLESAIESALYDDITNKELKIAREKYEKNGDSAKNIYRLINKLLA